jgi:hypothetical protein
MYKTISLALAVLAVPAVAQVRGSINRDAPTVSRSVSFKNAASLSVSYTAIRFGEGAWQGILKNTKGHEGFNKFAANKPIGSIKTSVTATASGREIPAGHYDLFFTVHEQAGFILNLKNKDDENAKPIRWRMAMSDTDSKSDRFSINLEPGSKAGSCTIAFSFGKKSVSVPLKLGAAKKKVKKVQRP